MKFSIPEHAYGALSLPASGPEDRRAQAAERMTRIKSLAPEQLLLALAFLVGYHPLALDAALDAVEPPARDDDTELEPYCQICDAPLGIFLAHAETKLTWYVLGEGDHCQGQRIGVSGLPCPRQWDA